MIQPKNFNKEFNQVVLLIEESRNRAFHKVNEELVLLYFKVGELVSEKVSIGTWGENTVEELATFIQLNCHGLKGFNRRGLYRMKQFYEIYTTAEFASAVRTHLQKPLNTFTTADGKQIEDTSSIQAFLLKTYLIKISWTNHRLILSKTKSAEEILYYLLIAIKEKYSSRDLERALNTAQFERIMLSNSLVSAVQTQIPEGLFKDPYIFEFLDLPDNHSENDLEKALILNLQKFILEIGKGFTYMGNQYRLQVGNKDYYTDLLFYHRDLQCLVLFELKIQEFEPEFLGKINFYLEALDRDVKRSFENPSIGILLCKGKDTEVVEYAMSRTTSPAIIADYETKLIPKVVLAKKLYQLVEQLSKINE